MATRKKTPRRKAKPARKRGVKPSRARRTRRAAKAKRAESGARRPPPKPARKKARATRKRSQARAAKAKPRRAAAPVAARAPATSGARAPRTSLRVVASAPELVARVLHYFPHARAGTLALGAPLALGDWIHVRGETSDFVQHVASLRVGTRSVERAESGEVAIALAERARPGDRVYALRPGA